MNGEDILNCYEEIKKLVNAGSKSVLKSSFTGRQGTIRDCLSKEVLTDSEIARPELKIKEDKYILYEPAAPKERLIILGGGHIALPLCEMAAKTGYAVTVVDDRPNFANTLRFPWAEAVICNSFMNALEQVEIRSSDYIVILTRGHRHDADCLRCILSQPETFYLGMIGSRRRVRGLLHMLEEEGYSKERMNRIYSPIGLDIGGILPIEIAVSIIAELISCRRKGNARGMINESNSDLDIDVIHSLVALKEPLAVVTVMETKGSTPRGSGAKMAVNQYGKIYGSIGGGCAEKEVIDKAVRIIGTGTYQVEEVDMTGDVAESDGMVCGGKMLVLIEDRNGENR